MKKRNKKDLEPQGALDIALNRNKLSRAVREKREKAGLNLRELAKLIRVNFSTLCRIERCESGSPKVEHLLALCRWLRKSPESFFDGVSVPLRARDHYATYVNAGKTAPAYGEQEDRDLCEELMPDQDQFFTVAAKGDSMINAHINDGDLLIAKYSKTASHGDIVVAIVKEEYCVKRLELKKGSYILKSANPDFDDIVVKHHDDKILGVVIHSVHRHQGTGPAIR